MPMYANAFAHMSAHFDKRGLSRRATQSPPQRSSDTGAGVPPARPALLRLTYKQPGICHRGGRGVSHTHMCTCQHAGMQTHTHPDTPRSLVVCSQRSLLTPLTGTRRISKWGEKPQSRSTSQRRALSIGSCLTPQGSRGRQRLSQEAITLLSGSEVCLECYLHLSGRGAGGQEVRQERDHFYHVLCMTSGAHWTIYMCLKVMQIEKEREGSWGNFDSFVNIVWLWKVWRDAKSDHVSHILYVSRWLGSHMHALVFWFSYPCHQCANILISTTGEISRKTLGHLSMLPSNYVLQQWPWPSREISGLYSFPIPHGSSNSLWS